MSLYTLNGLKKYFGRRLVLDIPYCSLEEGGMYGVLGANGAGKTTFLNLLAFVDQPTEGEIFFRSSGVCYAERQLRRLRQDVILVDQHPLLFSGTVYKNLEFGLKIRRVKKKTRYNQIRNALSLVGMERFIETTAENLSGGETQRVALARALVLSPRVLLCDEPTSNIDVAHQQIICELLKKLNKEQQMTIIFTTHDQALATDLADHSIILGSE